MGLAARPWRLCMSALVAEVELCSATEVALAYVVRRATRKSRDRTSEGGRSRERGRLLAPLPVTAVHSTSRTPGDAPPPGTASSPQRRLKPREARTRHQPTPIFPGSAETMPGARQVPRRILIVTKRILIVRLRIPLCYEARNVFTSLLTSLRAFTLRTVTAPSFC